MTTLAQTRPTSHVQMNLYASLIEKAYEQNSVNALKHLYPSFYAGTIFKAAKLAAAKLSADIAKLPEGKKLDQLNKDRNVILGILGKEDEQITNEEITALTEVVGRTLYKGPYNR